LLLIARSRSVAVPLARDPELGAEAEEWAVCELNVSVEIGEQDPVDRRVEHCAQHRRQPLEVAILLVVLHPLALDRIRHRVEAPPEPRNLVVSAGDQPIGQLAAREPLRRD
jgi:hypothetical protein